MTAAPLPAAALCLAALLPAQGPPPAKVSTARVVAHTFSPTLETVGQTEAWRRTTVSAEVDGRVEALLKDAGDPVSGGTVLLRIDTSRLEIQRRRAAAELELEKQNLAELEAGSREEEIRAAEAVLAEAEARLQEAIREHARVTRLIESGSVTEEELSGAVAAEDMARAQRDEKKAQLDLVREGPREEDKAQARARVAMRKAEVDRLSDDIERCEVAAPFDGVLTEKQVEEGHYVHAGDALFSLVQIDPVRVVVPVPERAVGTLRPGMEVTVRLDALAGEAFTAVVTAVVPAGDELARTFPLRLKLANPEERVLPGMLARAIVPERRPYTTRGVPRGALLKTPSGFLVFAVRGGKAVPVRVAPGDEEAGVVAVGGELEEGEAVVVRGNERLRAGQVVQVVAREEDDRSR